MDSITQIVLGAAVAEATLGKKIGNRAMLWGAIGGTIPDLDVISNLWLTQLEGLAAHRGITHSIFFAVVFGPVMAWLVHRMYSSPHHRTFAMIVRSVFMFAVGAGLLYLGFTVEGAGGWIWSLAGMGVLAGSYFFVKRRYITEPIAAPDASFKEWALLFFLAFLTHSLLDSFTVYGTQLLAPFSDMRVSWNNISVADPSYTTPFLLCLIIASCIPRTNVWRSRINWLGIGISSLYMIFTMVNQQRIKSIFQENLADNNITVSRSMVTPTILNNVLWYCVAETDSNLVFGRYSFLERDRKMKLKFVTKNDDIIEGYEDTKAIKTLKWFSNDYYTVNQLDNGHFVFGDMRYGPFDFQDYKNPENYIFKFELEEKDGDLSMLNEQGGPPPGDEREWMAALWQRIMGDDSSD